MEDNGSGDEEYMDRGLQASGENEPAEPSDIGVGGLQEGIADDTGEDDNEDATIPHSL